MQRLLVVEDDAALSKVMKFILESHGYEVLPAKSGNEAVDILKIVPVHMIISDLLMSNGDGFFLSDYLKKNHPEIPILICSGYLFESREKLMTGPEDLLSKPLIDKPFNYEDLLKAVQDTLAVRNIRT
jgi:CheY-like chemotaxis protein